MTRPHRFFSHYCNMIYMVTRIVYIQIRTRCSSDLSFQLNSFIRCSYWYTLIIAVFTSIIQTHPSNSFVVNGNFVDVISIAAVIARRNRVYCRHNLVNCSLLLSRVTVCIGCYLMQVLHLRTHWPRSVFDNYRLTLWGREEMAAILQDDVVKNILLNWNIYTLVEMSPSFVPKGSVNNMPALVPIMACRRSGGIAYFRHVSL